MAEDNDEPKAKGGYVTMTLSVGTIVALFTSIAGYGKMQEKVDNLEVRRIEMNLDWKEIAKAQTEALKEMNARLFHMELEMVAIKHQIIKK